MDCLIRYKWTEKWLGASAAELYPLEYGTLHMQISVILRNILFHSSQWVDYKLSTQKNNTTNKIYNYMNFARTCITIFILIFIKRCWIIFLQFSQILVRNNKSELRSCLLVERKQVTSTWEAIVEPDLAPRKKSNVHYSCVNLMISTTVGDRQIKIDRHARAHSHTQKHTSEF